MAQERVAAREKLQPLVQRLAHVSRTDFLAQHKEPILVQLTEPEGSNVGGARFGTLSMSKEELVFVESGLYAFPLRKATTNAFAMMITVGRASNNDIVLPYDGISKFHAYFSNTPTGWTIQDAKSMNGTHVSGQKLAPDQKAPLDLSRPDRPVDVQFSSVVKCKLYSPEGFFDLVTSLLAVLKPRG